jgi:hypothetical protein
VWSLFVDNRPASGTYDRVINGAPSFHQNGSLEFLGIREEKLYRVSVKK